VAARENPMPAADASCVPALPGTSDAGAEEEWPCLAGSEEDDNGPEEDDKNGVEDDDKGERRVCPDADDMRTSLIP